MKYIDADRLRAEIKERTLFYAGQANLLADTTTLDGFDEVLSIIDSLQQEQPELPGYDKALLEVKSKVDELYEEVGIGLCEYDCGLYNGIAETCMKLRGFINARLSNEQPEVDLEKEIHAYAMLELEPLKIYDANVGITITMHQLYQCAKHFYSLGLSQKGEQPEGGCSEKPNDLLREQPEVDLEKEEFVGVAESPLKTFPRVNDFECGGSYRH